MKVNSQIFRQYDIRGIVEEDLTPDLVNHLGKAFGSFIQKRNLKSVVVGADARLSSPRLKEELCKSLASVGCKVIDVGILATPTLYFAIQHLKTDSGIMITGSHNPSEYNGFKMNIGATHSIYGNDIQEIYQIICKEDYPATNSGKIEKFEGMIKIYQDYLISKFSLKKPLKVVVDAGNGAGGPIAPYILEKIGAKVIELFCDMDGNFPNHHPDPTVVANMQDLKNKVLEEKADLGIAFDGDADRLGIIDEKGEMLFGDQILTIFARDFLKKYPGEKIITDVKSSANLTNDIKNKGGIPIIYKTGHSMIKQKMKEDNILIGGEMSAHLFFKDTYFGFDDAIYAACRFLSILSQSNQKVSELLSDLPKLYNTPEIRVDCDDNLKFDLVEKVKKSFMAENYDIIDIDGMRINFPDGWGLVRASNTQPILVLRFEANCESRLLEIKAMVENRIKKIQLKS